MVDRDEHLDDVVPRREEIVGLIEQAVAQSGADEDAQEAVDEERVEDVHFGLLAVYHPHLLVYLLFQEEVPHDEVSQSQADEPAGGVPTYAETAYLKDVEVRIPNDIT